MNKLNATKPAQPLHQVAPKAAPTAPAATPVGIPAPVGIKAPATLPPDTFINEGKRVEVQQGRKPEAAVPVAPAKTPGQKVWDGVKKGLFVGTLSAPLVGVAIFGAVGTFLGLSSLAAAAIGAGAWVAMTAGAGALWGSNQ